MMNVLADEPRAFGRFPVEIWFHIKHMLWGPEYWKKRFDLVMAEVSNIRVLYSMEWTSWSDWRRLAFASRHCVLTERN